MGGTRAGGIKARDTNIEKHGADFYGKIGTLGGKVNHPKTRAFSKNPELARLAGAIGGKISKRRKHE